MPEFQKEDISKQNHEHLTNPEFNNEFVQLKKDEPKRSSLLTYSKIMNMLSLSCILFIIISFLSIGHNNYKARKYANDYVFNSEKDPKPFLSSDFNQNTYHFSQLYLADKEIFELKSSLIFGDNESALKKSGLNQYIDNKESEIFKDNLDLTEEAKNNFQKFLTTMSEPLSQDEVTKLRKVLLNAEKMNQYADFDSKNTLKIKNQFKRNLYELALLIRDDNSIAILNLYRKNINNKEFQQLILEQKTELLWNTYFKAQFGDKISPVAHLKDGTYK